MNAPVPTSNFLDRFESRLRASLTDPGHAEREPRVLLEASEHLAFAGAAKRMRPMLVDHFGAAVGLDGQVRLAVATAAELIHTASLLHDDVIDEGTERRGRPTANVQWDNSVAVLGGDLLLCIALEQLYDLPRPVTRTAVDLVAEMTRAAMLEVQARRERNWDLGEWETIAVGKTGSLLAWCGTASAIAAGRSELAERLAGCGRHLGLAFQLTDDILDLVGEKTGKDRFADLRNANPSFPVAFVRSHDGELRAALDELWATPTANDDDLDTMAAAIVDSGAPDETLRRVEAHLDEALSSLGEFADRPGGEHVAAWADQLRNIARHSLENS